MRIVCWQAILMKYHTIFFSKMGKMSLNLSSAAVFIGALRVLVVCFRIFGWSGWASGSYTTDGTCLHYPTPNSTVNLCNIYQWSCRRGRSLLYPFIQGHTCKLIGKNDNGSDSKYCKSGNFRE